MGEKSGEYWRERFRQLEEAQNDTSVQTMREIEQQFRRAERALNAKINAWYGRFAVNNEISMTEARRLLNSDELEEFRWDVNEYIKHGRENAKDERWIKELENASAKVHISRLEALKVQTQQEMEKLFGNYSDAVDKHITGIYTSSYYHTAFEVQRGIGIGWDMQKLNAEKVNDIIHKPWAVDGRNFSERIWTSKTKLINSLHNSLTRMCITGESPERIISEFAKSMDVSRSQAANIIQTESAAFSAKAQESCYADLDVEEFEVVETLDNRTCSVCGDMDGKHFPMKDYQIGVTVPPFHPRCRGCTCPYFDDEFTVGEKRAARGEDGKTYYVPADMTYKEWKSSFVEGGDKSELTPATSEKQMEEIIENTPTSTVSNEPSANEIATNAIKDSYEHKRTDKGFDYVPFDELDDTVAVKADFTGMDEKLAKTSAEQFALLSNEYETTCQKITVEKFDAMLGSAPASTSLQMITQSSVITLNKNIVKDSDKFRERMQKAVERGQFPKMDAEQYDKYVITHEFAHTLMDFDSSLKNVVNADTSRIRKARKEIVAIHNEYKQESMTVNAKLNELFNDSTLNSNDMDAVFKRMDLIAEQQAKLDAIKISNYADMDIDEFMAEAFADAKLGSNPSEYSKRVETVIDKYFKKDVVENITESVKLSVNEEWALNKYVSFDSYLINDTLRTNGYSALSDVQKEIVDNLDSALKKMPTYSGNLVRDIDFSDFPNRQELLDEFWEEFIVDDEIQFDEYISTTTNLTYTDNPSVRIYIQNSAHGRNIRNLNPKEQEVLYERNSRFKVITKMINPDDGIYYILLEEA